MSAHRRPARWGRWSTVVVCLAVALGLADCVTSSGPAAIVVTAYFSDVGDLVSGAQVQLADIPVGSVASISLAGSRAKVVMDLSPSARVPLDVTAAIDRTTILGEQFVELEVPRHSGTAPTALAADHPGTSGGATAVAPPPPGPTPRLVSGDVISRTTVIPDVEQLISAGAQVFGSVSTSELEQIIAAGGEGFGGQEASLRSLLNDFSAVAAGYATRTDDVKAVITDLDQLGTSLAPSSGADAQALTNLNQTVSVLAQQSSRFNNLLEALDQASIQGRSLLEQYYPQISDQLKALDAVSTQLAENQQSLAGVLATLPKANVATSNATRDDYVQVLENIIVCGVPGAGSSSAPAFTCQPHSGSGG